MEKYYAGVGSRRTPNHILTLMACLARALRYEGWVLRSGHADGADQAFEAGAAHVAELFLPWPSFNENAPFHDRTLVFNQPQRWAYAHAMAHHPAWGQLKQGGRKLMARNVHQVLGWVQPGEAGFCPVTFVVGYAPTDKDGRPTGGTAQAFRIADHWEIPVFNLAVPDDRRRIEARLDEMEAAAV